MQSRFAPSQSAFATSWRALAPRYGRILSPSTCGGRGADSGRFRLAAGTQGGDASAGMQLLQRMRAGKDDPAAVEECCFELADDPLQLADVPPAQVAYEVGAACRGPASGLGTAARQAPARSWASHRGVMGHTRY